MTDRLPEMIEIPFEQGVDRVHSGHGPRVVGSLPPSVRWKPSEPNREHHLEDEAEPEDRDDPDDGSVQPDRDVQLRVASSAADDAGEDPDDTRHDHRADRYLDRRGQPKGNLPDHRLSEIIRSNRAPQVAPEEMGHVVEVLLPWRLVETELDASGLNHLRRWFPAAPKREDRIARQHAQDEEDGRQQDQEHRYGEGGTRHRVCQERPASRHRPSRSTSWAPKNLSRSSKKEEGPGFTSPWRRGAVSRSPRRSRAASRSRSRSRTSRPRSSSGTRACSRAR